MKELRQKRNSRRLCKWAALCAACMLFLAMGLTGWAARTGNVRVNDVNVRSEASAESNRVCQLPINTTVNIVEETTDSDGKVWYSVTFTLDGAEKAGWIRSDMLNVSEDAGSEGEVSAGTAAEYTIQEPVESYNASDALTQTTLSVGESSFTAWQVNPELTGGQELYVVAAARADGSIGWFYYDPVDETFQKDMGQFAGSSEEEPEGLIEALQSELTGLKESSAKQLSMRMYIIIGLAVLCVILLVLVIVFGLKYRNAAYEYYDDDEDDDEDDDYDEDGDDEEEDDFDDFFAAAKKKQADEDGYDKNDYDIEDEAEEESDFEETDELPEIDMSAVLEIEEEAKKETEEEPENVPVSEAEEDGLDDFDIEILDWEDLGL